MKILKLATVLSGLTLSVMTAASAEAHTLFSCQVTQVHRKALESFGEFNLEVYRPRNHGAQPEALVNVTSPSRDHLALELGGNVFSGAQEYELATPELIAYNVESSDIELGYLVKFDINNGGKGELFGYSTDIPEDESIDAHLESLATLKCRRTAP